MPKSLVHMHLVPIIHIDRTSVRSILFKALTDQASKMIKLTNKSSWAGIDKYNYFDHVQYMN